MRGRPAKAPHLKYLDIHLKLHPKALRWARAEAKRRGIGYQTLINEALRQHVEGKAPQLEETLRRILREEIKAAS